MDKEELTSLTEENDNVMHPSHYIGKIETIDFIEDKLSDEGFKGFCLGNSIKYISRHDKKGKPVEDLEKAEVYLGWGIRKAKEIERKKQESREAIERRLP